LSAYTSTPALHRRARADLDGAVPRAWADRRRRAGSVGLG